MRKSGHAEPMGHGREQLQLLPKVPPKNPHRKVVETVEEARTQVPEEVEPLCLLVAVVVVVAAVGTAAEVVRADTPS